MHVTGLHTVLQEWHVGRLVLAGLAGDVCVASTALDAVALGYQVAVLRRATRPTREWWRLRDVRGCRSNTHITWESRLTGEGVQVTDCVQFGST
jgi:hypothetical protein